MHAHTHMPHTNKYIKSHVTADTSVYCLNKPSQKLRILEAIPFSSVIFKARLTLKKDSCILQTAVIWLPLKNTTL